MISTCSFYILLDLMFQIQSTVSSSYLTSSTLSAGEVGEVVESRHEDNMATSLYILLYTQQIINPLIFLYSEFLSK